MITAEPVKVNIGLVLLSGTCEENSIVRHGVSAAQDIVPNRIGKEVNIFGELGWPLKMRQVW